MGDQEFIQKMMDDLYPRLNKPGDSYYLPDWVKKSGYDPYGPFNWEVGQIKDQTVLNSAATICQAIDVSGTSGCPAGQRYINAGMPPNYPTLTLSNCKLNGMRNVVADRPMAQPPNGRVIIMQTELGTLTLVPPITNLLIDGNFTFTNYCCCSTDKKTCSGAPQAQVGQGKFTIAFPGAAKASQHSNAVITFTITDLRQGVLTMQVNSVILNVPMGDDGAPSADVTVDITSFPDGADREDYSNIAMEAFNSPDARKMIHKSVNDTINTPATLATISDILSKAIAGFLRDNHMYPFDKSAAAIV
jgi:hypothetical protein